VGLYPWLPVGEAFTFAHFLSLTHFRSRTFTHASLKLDFMKKNLYIENNYIPIITENFSNDIGMSFGIDKCKTQSICRGHYENLEYITQEGEIIKNLNKGELYKYLGINQSNHIQHSIIKENLEKQFYLRIKSILNQN
jgi:hypothetical protein